MAVFNCGRLLNIHWHMVVVVGRNVLHHVKREGNCPGRGNVRGNMSEGECPTLDKRDWVGKNGVKTEISKIFLALSRKRWDIRLRLL